MNDKPDMAKAWAALMVRTQNPLAPVIIQKAFKDLDNLGKLFAYGADKDKARVYSDMLLDQFDDNKIETISTEPEYILALVSTLLAALPGYVHATMHMMEEKDNG